MDNFNKTLDFVERYYSGDEVKWESMHIIHTYLGDVENMRRLENQGYLRCGLNTENQIARFVKAKQHPPAGASAIVLAPWLRFIVIFGYTRNCVARNYNKFMRPAEIVSVGCFVL